MSSEIRERDQLAASSSPAPARLEGEVEAELRVSNPCKESTSHQFEGDEVVQPVVSNTP